MATKLDTETYIKLATEVHKGRYLYPNLKYLSIHEKVEILCQVHGAFWQSANSHKRGNGCPKCRVDAHKARYDNQFETFKSKARKVHGDIYDYSLSEYKKAKINIAIICKKHNKLFYQTPDSHINRQAGCPICAIEKSANSKKSNKASFIRKAKEVHGETFDYKDVTYVSSLEKVLVTCNNNHTFLVTPGNHLQGRNCPYCSRGQTTSIQEKELEAFVNTVISNYYTNTRKVLSGKELDIYIPSKKIAMEFDGAYWHSEKFVDYKYHLSKTEECEKQGIQLIHIFEDEWETKQQIVKSRLRQILGCQVSKVYARQTEVREVPPTEARLFLQRTHIQGAVGATVRLGLYYEDKLVALMTFGKPRICLGRKTFEEGEWELLRFCTELDTTVVGGASKLLKYFEKHYSPNKVFSYADRRWSQGGLYTQLGFTLASKTRPNYFYVKNGKRYNRFKFRKSELSGRGETEHEKVLNTGYLRIYDCGSLKFIKLFPQTLNLG